MIDSFKLVIKQSILNIKNFFSNKINIFVTLLFFVIAFSLCIVFIPLRFSYGICLVVSIIPLTSTIYYSSNLSFRNSTLYSNSSLGKSNRWTFNVSTIFVMVIFGSIAAIILYFMFFFLNFFNVLLADWWQYTASNSIENESLKYNFNIWILFVSLYCAIFLSLMNFCISFMICRVYDDSKFYFSIILSLVLLDIVFGGSLNDYFGFKNEPDSGLTFIKISEESTLFPWTIYPISFIFPFYSQGELINSTVSMSMEKYSSDYQAWLPYYGEGINVAKDTLKLFGGYHNTLWTASLYFPYIEMVGFIAVGSILSKYKKR